MAVSSVTYSQIFKAIAHNAGMDKMLLRQIVVDNIVRRMESTPRLSTQTALAAEAKVSQPYLSELLRGESAPTTDLLAKLADAFGCQPWELLADSEATRKAALEKMILGPRVSNERAAEKLPAAPMKEAAARRRKKR